MEYIDLIHGDFGGVVERSYPREAEGWIDGVYRFRALEEKPAGHIAAEAAGQGLLLRARALVEESEPLGGDANTIACATYCEGTFVRLPLDACDWRLEIELLSAEDAEVAIVANEDERAHLSLKAGEPRKVALEVPLTKRGLDLTVAAYDPAGETTGWSEVLLRSLAYEKVERAAAPSPRILIAADSTAQTYFDRERPQSGWGEWLYWYLYEGHVASVSHDDTGSVRQARLFKGAGPDIYNKALGGRGFKSYLAEHRWEKLLSVARPGDAVLIDFGLNDASKTRPMRYIPVEEFASWIDRYVACVEDRGARPVLLTSTPLFHAPDGEFQHEVTLDYVEVVRAYAAEHGLPLIDVRAEFMDYVRGLPPQNREALWLRARPFQYPSHPDGVKDPCHLSTLGAFKVAGIVARGLAKALPWVELASDVAAEPEPARTPAPVRELTAESVKGIVGLEGALRWDPPEGGADYYVVEKRNAATGRLYDRAVTVQPSYLDLPLPAQARTIEYRVSAWIDAEASEAASVRLTFPPDDDPAQALG